MGRVSKKNKVPPPAQKAGDDITIQLELIEQQNISIQKTISSFGARLNMIRHLLSKI